MKLQLVYIRVKGAACIQHPHWDLCTGEKNPKNIACILVNGKENVKVLKEMIQLYNNRKILLGKGCSCYDNSI